MFKELAPKKAALTAGLALFATSMLAVFANFIVLENMVVSGNAAATAQNVADDRVLFLSGAFGFLTIAILDVVAAWALYFFLKKVDKKLSAVTAWLRVMAATGLALATFNLFRAYFASAADKPVMPSIDMFYQILYVAFIFLGIHLVLLGYLAIKSGFMPKFFVGFLLMVAGLGYLIDSFGNNFISTYSLQASSFTFAGVLFLTIWLLFKGTRLPR